MRHRLFVLTLFLALGSVVAAAAGAAPVTPLGTFLDDNGNIHEPNIEALAEEGITKGCGTDVYCPADSVRRDQMASFLARALNLTPSTTDAFVDDNGNLHEANINALAAAGITTGCSPLTNEYCPSDSVRRDQMASLLARALGLTPLPPPSVDEANVARIYFFLDQPEGGPFLATVARYLPGALTPDDAVDLLLEGPLAAELAQTPAFSSNVPTGVVRNEPVAIAGDTATVDLSDNFDDGGGTATMTGRLAELTFTVTVFDSIDYVKLELDGVPVTVFSSEGLIIPDEGLSREHYLPTMTDPIGAGIVAELSPESPAWFEFVESPVEVRGLSRTFEATVEYALFDNDGTELASGFATTGGGGPEFGPMSIDITYSVSYPQVGTLQLWWDPPIDGDPGFADLRETAVWLMP